MCWVNIMTHGKTNHGWSFHFSDEGVSDIITAASLVYDTGSHTPLARNLGPDHVHPGSQKFESSH